MTIEERLALLAEAEDFFSDLSDAGDAAYSLGLRKAAALGTVKEGLELFNKKMFGGKERTEETLEKALDFTIREEFIEDMVAHYGIKGDELDFYLGGFGLAKSILTNDKEGIDGFRQTQAAYDDLVQEKLGQRNLFDLIHK